MAAASGERPHLTVAQLILRRLKELQRTPSDLARALQVPESYVSDLLAGRRLPPGPNRSDVYTPISKFVALRSVLFTKTTSPAPFLRSA